MCCTARPAHQELAARLLSRPATNSLEKVAGRLKSKEKGKGKSLLSRGGGESDTLLDVAFQALDGLGQQLLLLICDVAEDIDSLLSSVGLATSQQWLPLKRGG